MSLTKRLEEGEGDESYYDEEEDSEESDGSRMNE